MKFIIYFLYFLLFLSTFTAIYFIIIISKEKRMLTKIKIGFNSYLEKEQELQIELLKKQNYIINKKKFKHVENLRKLIKKSTINNKIKILTPTIFIILEITSAIMFYAISERIMNVMSADLIITLFGFLFPQLILKILVLIKGSKVDKLLIDYLNLLINFCAIKDDIVYGIGSAVKFIPEPLKSFSEEFVFEVKHGVPPYNALNNLGAKIENPQFKFLCKALALCNKTSGKYLLVLIKEKELYVKTYEKEMDRKNEAIKGAVQIGGVVIAALIIFVLLIFINPNLIEQLKNSFIGRILITYVLVSILIVIRIAVKSTEFEY